MISDTYVQTSNSRVVDILFQTVRVFFLCSQRDSINLSRSTWRCSSRAKIFGSLLVTRVSCVIGFSKENGTLRTRASATFTKSYETCLWRIGIVFKIMRGIRSNGVGSGSDCHTTSIFSYLVTLLTGDLNCYDWVFEDCANVCSCFLSSVCRALVESDI